MLMGQNNHTLWQNLFKYNYLKLLKIIFVAWKNNQIISRYYILLMARPSRKDAARGVFVLKYRRVTWCASPENRIFHAALEISQNIRCATRQLALHPRLGCCPMRSAANPHQRRNGSKEKRGPGLAGKRQGNESIPLIPLLLLHASPRNRWWNIWERGRLPLLGRARSLWLEAPPRNYGLSKLNCPPWAGSACKGWIRCCGPLQGLKRTCRPLRWSTAAGCGNNPVLAFPS